MSCQEHFIKMLRSKGHRLTPKRMVVLDTLHTLPGYSTAEEVWEGALRADPSLDRATVYRTLELLQSLDMVLVLDREGDLHHYSLHTGQSQHFHLLCTRCGQVIDADLDLLQPLQKNIRSHLGFDVDQRQLTLSGLCRDCARVLEDS